LRRLRQPEPACLKPLEPSYSAGYIGPADQLSPAAQAIGLSWPELVQFFFFHVLLSITDFQPKAGNFHSAEGSWMGI
jgi:hypothetical protein